MKTLLMYSRCTTCLLTTCLVAVLVASGLVACQKAEPLPDSEAQQTSMADVADRTASSSDTRRIANGRKKDIKIRLETIDLNYHKICI